jgi:hypothetical protein
VNGRVSTPLIWRFVACQRKLVSIPVPEKAAFELEVASDLAALPRPLGPGCIAVAKHLLIFTTADGVAFKFSAQKLFVSVKTYSVQIDHDCESKVDDRACCLVCLAMRTCSLVHGGARGPVELLPTLRRGGGRLNRVTEPGNPDSETPTTYTFSGQADCGGSKFERRWMRLLSKSHFESSSKMCHRKTLKEPGIAGRAFPTMVSFSVHT